MSQTGSEDDADNIIFLCWVENIDLEKNLGDGATNTRNLEAVDESGLGVIITRERNNLGLVVQAAEVLREDDLVVISLKLRAGNCLVLDVAAGFSRGGVTSGDMGALGTKR